MHGNGRRADGFRRSVTAYTQLVRLPNLFTAPPDIILGAALVAAGGIDVAGGAVVGLAVASMLLYAAGTTLNDYVDASEDARLRPERPIPTDAVSRRQALALGAALLTGGVGIAVVSGGILSGIVAVVLALAIILYDGVFKGSTLGFLFMGGCRGLNVLLGTTVTGSLVSDALPLWGIAVPLLVTVYIAAITFMAESEAGESTSLAVPIAIAGTAIAVVGVIGLLVVRSPSLVKTALAGVLLAGFAGWIGRALRTAYANSTPETIGPAVGTCVLALVVFDAAVAAITGIGWALAALTFLAPAVGLSGGFDVT